MFAQVTCGSCNFLIKADEKFFGKTVKCPNCKAHLKIPDPRLQQAVSVDPLIGKTIAHYRIQALLGQGAMGKVYRAKNTKLVRTCALKILPEELVKEDKSRLDRFIVEARSAASVEHPNVVRVHFLGKEDDTYFIEMQYVDGQTLDAVLERRGRLEVKQAAAIVRDVAAGLTAVHAKEIIHRDIKPSNVMITKDGQVKVADFGLAKLSEATTKCTMSGMILGTPLYMSPEQGEGQRVDHRSDIYSLGAVLYHLVTGQPPYTADSLPALLNMHSNHPIPDAREVVPDLSPALAAIVTRMLAKKAVDRYQDCVEVFDDLDAFLNSGADLNGAGESTVTEAGKPKTSVGGGDKRSWRPSGRRWVPVIAAMAGLITAGGVLHLLNSGRTEAPATVERGHPAAKWTATTFAPSVVAEPVTVSQPSADEPRSVDKPKSAMPEAVAPEGETRPEPGPEVVKKPSQSTPDAAAVPDGATTLGDKDAPAKAATIVPAPAPASVQASPNAGAAISSADFSDYVADIRAVNERIDACDYAGASARAEMLQAKYPDLIRTKLDNINRILMLQKRCIDRVNSGKIKLEMGDISRRYAFAGAIKRADKEKVTAKISKKWEDLDPDEIAAFYGAVVPTLTGPGGAISSDDRIALAAFLMEGTLDEKRLAAALDQTDKAAGMGADVEALLSYLNTLREMEEAYGAVKRADDGLAGQEGDNTRKSAGKPPDEEEVVEEGEYVATKTGSDRIAHPLSKSTYTIRHEGKKIKVPQGMVYVPAGEFTMGDGKSEHEVYLDAYFIGKREVTNTEWKAFTDATGFRPLPSHWKEDKIPKGKEKHPVIYVSWEDVQAYCEWCGKRLPTEAEWEKAARGCKGLKYPWGNAWDPLLCNSSHNLRKFGFEPRNEDDGWWPTWRRFTRTSGYEQLIATGGYNTEQVGSYGTGASPYGCLDMIGNAAEWCSDWYTKKYHLLKDAERNPRGPGKSEADEMDIGEVKCKAKLLRGGAWNSYSCDCNSVSRGCDSPWVCRYSYGFRVSLSHRP